MTKKELWSNPNLDLVIFGGWSIVTRKNAHGQLNNYISAHVAGYDVRKKQMPLPLGCAYKSYNLCQAVSDCGELTLAQPYRNPALYLPLSSF